MNVIKKLNEVGVVEQSVIDAVIKLGVNAIEDFAELTREDLLGAGLNPVQASKLIKEASSASVMPSATLANTSFDGILPAIPDDGNWLDALKVGGVLKPDQSTVIAAIRAALAQKVGLFDVPAKLNHEMEKFADENDEPIDPVFFKLRHQITQRTYADVFEAIPGLDGSFITDARKHKLFERMRDALWPTVELSYTQLKAWQDNWLQGASNPSIMMMTLAGGSSALPPGLMSPPDTGVLRDCSDDINKAINAAFKGAGAQVASALAYDANQIRKTLEDPRLPMLVGAANRDQMIKKLGVSVSANYARQEQNIVKYVLGFMQAKDIAADGEAAYFSALCMLGSQIDWKILSQSAPPNPSPSRSTKIPNNL